MSMLGASILLICTKSCPRMGTSCHREVTHVLTFPVAIGPEDQGVIEMLHLSIILRLHLREEIPILLIERRTPASSPGRTHAGNW
jgi:hypothetical protein